MTDKERKAIEILNRLHAPMVLSEEEAIEDDDYFFLLSFIIDKPQEISVQTQYLADNHWGAIPNQFREVLKKQNLEFVGGKIVSIEPEPFKLDRGVWYMCIKSYDDGISQEKFNAGTLYQSCAEGCLVSHTGHATNFKYRLGEKIADYFRPATECEILKAKFDSPELPEIVKEQVREITEKPTVSWDSVNGTLTFNNLTKEQEEKLKSALIGEPKQELTEFDSIQKIIHDLLSSTNGEWLEEDYMTEMSKNISEDIRKQIVQEIDTEKLTEKQTVLLRAANGCDSPIIEFGANCYKRGIEHCLEEIELKGIIEKGG